MEIKLGFGSIQGSAAGPIAPAVPLDESLLYDVIIAGAGPAGLTAAVYCLRKGLRTGIIATDIGGQLNETWDIENYMGYRHIEGSALTEKFREHAASYPLQMITGAGVASISDGPEKKIILDDGKIFRARTLILATGKTARKLKVPGEKELTGRGVAYCATCDAPLFRDKKVAVAGGGNSGLEAVLNLAGLASGVTLIQFLDRLTADRILIDKLNGLKKVDVLLEHEILEIKGKGKVEAVTIKNRKTGAFHDIQIDGLFIEAGLVPNSGFAGDVLARNEQGEIEIDYACRTNRPGIFAAGDVTGVPYKQIIIAAGEGAKAALSASDYLMMNIPT